MILNTIKKKNNNNSLSKKNKNIEKQHIKYIIKYCN